MTLILCVCELQNAVIILLYQNPIHLTDNVISLSVITAVLLLQIWHAWATLCSILCGCQKGLWCINTLLNLLF